MVKDRFIGSRDVSGSVEVVGLDMEEEREAAFEEAVDKACNLLGNFDAFVNCYTYEGSSLLHLWLGLACPECPIITCYDLSLGKSHVLMADLSL